MNIIEELEQRGLIHTITDGTKEQLLKESTTFYVGTDPTGQSLHVGHLQAFMTARLLQKYGHKPIILVGQFTASLGDPSFKEKERPLLSKETIQNNTINIKKQLSKIIDFNSDMPNKAIMVNNNDWFGDMSFYDFARNIGKSITVNYLLAKDSVQQRLSRENSGISLTEFLYGPVQSYDFLHLYQNYNCKMQIGGSDQFGNITGGMELIRKNLFKKDVFAFVFPLVTRADGKKFGKSEGGKNIWLDPNLTNPYEFMQFWLNQSDSDAKTLIKRFTLLPLDEIEKLIKEHEKAPHLRLLQKTLAKELTIIVHSKEDYNKAVEASNIIFGDSNNNENIKKLDDATIISAFANVPNFTISNDEITNNITIMDLCIKNKIFKSKGEFKKLVQNGGLYMNMIKLNNFEQQITVNDLINNKFIIIRQGKKKYFLFLLEKK